MIFTAQLSNCFRNLISLCVLCEMLLMLIKYVLYEFEIHHAISLCFFFHRYQSKKTVVQEYFPNPLLVFSMPVNIRAYVLVTSINPLRAFVHSEGLVHFRHDYPRGFKKVTINSIDTWRLKGTLSEKEIDGWFRGV